jgi:hypothetical protein
MMLDLMKLGQKTSNVVLTFVHGRLLNSTRHGWLWPEKPRSWPART